MTNQSQLSTFNFESNFIRVLSVNDEPWFVAKDLCDTLDISNPSKAILNLDDDEKMISSDSNLKLGSAGNGAQSLSLVSESGMYTLILRCRDAVKKGSIPHRFRKWVTAEVLPQIRKTGKYERKTTTDERTGLRQAVSALVSKKGLIYSEAYSLIHQRFNVEHIDELTPEQIGMAVEYVHRIVLEGELIIDKPNLPGLPLSDIEIQEFVNYWFASTRFHESVYFLMQKLKSFRSRELDSVDFNYNVCEKYLRRTHSLIKELIKVRNHSHSLIQN